MFDIRVMTLKDREFWFTLDKHISEKMFEKKVADGMGYVLFDDGEPVGLLRYNLLWDSIPFCTMLFVAWSEQRKGRGTALMRHWEEDMKAQGFDMIMTSTQVNETSQHFYRKLGYEDAGGMIFTIPNHEQPMEMFMAKAL